MINTLKKGLNEKFGFMLIYIIISLKYIKIYERIGFSEKFYFFHKIYNFFLENFIFLYFKFKNNNKNFNMNNFII